MAAAEVWVMAPDEQTRHRGDTHTQTRRRGQPTRDHVKPRRPKTMFGTEVFRQFLGLGDRSKDHVSIHRLDS